MMGFANNPSYPRQSVSLSAEGAAAVDPDLLAGDEIRSLPQQIEQRPHEIVRVRLAAEAALGGQHGAHVGLAVIVVAIESDVIRRQRVDADAAFRRARARAR